MQNFSRGDISWGRLPRRLHRRVLCELVAHAPQEIWRLILLFRLVLSLLLVVGVGSGASCGDDVNVGSVLKLRTLQGRVYLVEESVQHGSLRQCLEVIPRNCEIHRGGENGSEDDFGLASKFLGVMPEGSNEKAIVSILRELGSVDE